MQSRIFERADRQFVHVKVGKRKSTVQTKRWMDKGRFDKNGKNESRRIKKIVLTQKNIVNIFRPSIHRRWIKHARALPWTRQRGKKTGSGGGGRRRRAEIRGGEGRDGLDCMVITINNGNLVCKWVETPGRAVPTYNFPPFCGRRALALSRAVSHIEMPWVNICLRSRKLILFKSQVRG